MYVSLVIKDISAALDKIDPSELKMVMYLHIWPLAGMTAKPLQTTGLAMKIFRRICNENGGDVSEIKEGLK